VRARVSIEARITLGWREYVGDTATSIWREHFRTAAGYKK
jgi:transketolase